MKDLMPPIDTPDNKFHDGDPVTKVEGTIVESVWFNDSQDCTRDVQQELISILTAASMSPDPAKHNQVLLAIQSLTNAATTALNAIRYSSLTVAPAPTGTILDCNDIPHDTTACFLQDPATLNGPGFSCNIIDYTARSNGNNGYRTQIAVSRDGSRMAIRTFDTVKWSDKWMEIGVVASELPVGSPTSWPSATPPTGWIFCNGAAFSKTTYPKLAVAYPSGLTPDLRGVFIRGLDNGKGYDLSRALLSYQDSDNKEHDHSIELKNASGQGGGTDYALRTLYVNIYNATYTTEKSGGSESRPRNIAFNYIVRAA